jgi:nicotinate-nucleotide adenylyltransferase
MDIEKLTIKIHKQFQKSFGYTPLRQRNEDILSEAIEVSRWNSIDNLKEELGDLLCSTLVACEENNWSPEDLINSTLTKIKRREKQYRAYGRKLKTVILGGAFDPITPGHIQVAEFLLNSSKEFDSVWIQPCYKHMFGKKMESPEHRLEMCRLATKHDRRIFISDYEIRKKLGGETYFMVKNLLNEKIAKNEQDFSIAMGMDNANTFNKWANYQDLERMIRCVIIPRTGVEMLKNGWYLKPPHMLLIPEKPLLEISSTRVRKTLKKNWLIIKVYLDVSMSSIASPDFIHPDVLKYIEQNGLYKDE